MMYPVIMIFIGSIIMTGLFVYVIPQITQIFADSDNNYHYLPASLWLSVTVFVNTGGLP